MELNRKTLRNLFLLAGGCVVLYWILHETERIHGVFLVMKSLFSPFILGAVLAFIINVPMRGIERLLGCIKRPTLRRVLAILLTFVSIVIVIAVVVQQLVPQLEETIKSLASAMPGFFERVRASVMAFLEENPDILHWVMNNTELETLDWAEIAKNLATLAGNSLSAIFNSLLSAVGTVTDVVMDTIIGLVFCIYCLNRKEILARQGRRILYAVFPERYSDEIVRILRLSNSTFSSFISGQCLEAVILGCLFAVSMLIFRMPYVPLVSVLVAVTALVPIVGAFVGCIFGAFFILVSNPMQAVGFVVMFLILQQIENNMIYPRVVGTSIGLPGMWVLVAVTVGGSIMGVAGMLLMIPVTSVMYTLAREYTAARLTKLGISEDKLQDQPPELNSRFRDKRQKAKQKREHKKLDQYLNKMKKSK